MMRSREQAFYGSVNGARSTALGVATSMADDANYNQPTTLSAPFLNNVADEDIMTASTAADQANNISAVD